MENVLAILSKPIVLSLVTLTIGSYLFTRLTERRSKREKIREKALQLLEDVGNDLNTAISLMYRHIRNGDFEVPKDSALDEKRAGLFTKRFSVKIKSKVFLQSDEFWQRYDQLTFEVDKIVRLMISLKKDYKLEEIVNKIKEERSRFAKKWPCEERSTYSKYPPPSDELVIWADMVWDRSNTLISMNLNSLFR